MMRDNKTGPFKKNIDINNKKLTAHLFWIAISLTVIALSQIPIALESTLGIFEDTNSNESQSLKERTSK